MNRKTEVRYTFFIGRVLIALAFLAFLSAWFTHSTLSTFLGLDWSQLLVDAIALVLTGAGMFLDAFWDMHNTYD